MFINIQKSRENTLSNNIELTYVGEMFFISKYQKGDQIIILSVDVSDRGKFICTFVELNLYLTCIY